MAEELHIRARVKYNPSEANQKPVDTKLLEKFVTMTGTEYTSGVQEIDTSEEKIVVSADIGTQGWWLILNLDSTNYVEAGHQEISKLAYDGGTVICTAGSTLTDSVSGATATILFVSGNSTSGTLILTDVVGTFGDDNAITDDGDTPGAAVVNGVLSTVRSVLNEKIEAGEFALFKASGHDVYAMADTSAVKVQFWCWED